MLSDSVVSHSLRPHGLYPTRHLCPWILQARTLEWVAMPSCRGSSQPKDQKHLSCGPCPAGGFFILPLSHQGMPRSNYNSLKTVEYGLHIHNALLTFRCSLRPVMQEREGILAREVWVLHKPEQVKSYETEPPRKELTEISKFSWLKSVSPDYSMDLYRFMMEFHLVNHFCWK